MSHAMATRTSSGKSKTPQGGWTWKRRQWLTILRTRLGFLPVMVLLLLISGCGKRVSALPSASDTPISSQSATTLPASNNLVDAPVATTGCGKTPSLAPGMTTEMTIVSAGRQRMYRLHLPIGYASSQPTPLVFDIPGHGETALQQERYSQYSDLADQQRFLVVYPQGTLGPDGKLGWATFGKNASDVDDVLFFSDMLTFLQQRLCVDAHRIYATGISNGGGMTNLLACQMAGRIAAFAPVAAAIYPLPQGCHPARAVSYLEFHGTSDPLVPYNGNPALQFSPVIDILQAWATRDHCTGGPTVFFQQAEVTGLQWTSCQADTIVQHYRIAGGGHTWPGATIPTFLGATTHTISATTLSWQFFQNTQLP